MPNYRVESYYVSKDEGGTQQQRQLLCSRTYDDVRVDFIEGKTAINKADVIKHMYTFYARCGLCFHTCVHNCVEFAVTGALRFA